MQPDQAAVQSTNQALFFHIEPAVASGIYIKLAFDQHFDSDLKPNPEDFSISLPVCEAADASTVRPIHVEFKDRPTDHGSQTNVILVLEKPLPPVSEMELHYHPLELLMWSNTASKSVEPFILPLPVRLSRQPQRDSLSTKLLETLAKRNKRESAPAPLPPVITHMDGERINICLNRQLIPHQGVAAGDFRAEAEDRWVGITAAAIHQSSEDESHEIQLAMAEKLTPGDSIALAFKAKRYPMTSLDGSQISQFKVSARYLGEGQFQLIETQETTGKSSARFETEKYHLSALEHLLDEDVSKGKAFGSVFLESLAALTQAVGRPLTGNKSEVAIPRTQMLMGVALVLIILFLVIAIFQMLSGFSTSTTTNRPQAADIDLSATLPCTLNFTTGNQYSGTCNGANQPHGKGTFQWTSGSTYEGEFQNGKRAGYGFMTYNNGAKYDGQWRDDKKEGNGIYWSNTGDRFEGEFSQGKMTANGVCYKTDGTQLRGFCPN